MQKPLALIAAALLLSACNNSAQAPATNAAPEQAPAVQEAPAQPSTEPLQAAQPGLPQQEIEQIEALLQPIRTFKAQIGLWDKLPVAERMQIIQSFAPAEQQLRSQWPQLNQCANALNATGILASDTNVATTTIANGSNTPAHRINAMTWTAFGAGEAYAACTAELDALAGMAR